MRRKGILVLAVLVVVACILAGCGKTTTAANFPTAVAATTSTVARSSTTSPQAVTPTSAVVSLTTVSIGETSEAATTSTTIWQLTTSAKSLEQLAEQLVRGLEGTGVPAFVPSELPPGYTVAQVVRTLSGSTDNPAFWQMSGTRPGPRAAGYRVFFSNGRTWLRLDVNPPADHGNVQWKGTGTDWNGQELESLEYPDSFWVRVPVPYDMVVEVWGPLEMREELLSLASQIRGVVQPAGS